MGAFRIIDFEDRHARSFRDLNLAWIPEYFPVEAEDERQLDDPRGILDDGGNILLAVVGDTVVGTCALLAHGKRELELAKFAVAADQRGTGLGSALIKAAIQRARSRDMKRIVLLTNARLRDARRLFDRSGFVEIPLPANPYEHTDVAMALELE